MTAFASTDRRDEPGKAGKPGNSDEPGSEQRLHPPGSGLLHAVDRFASRPNLALVLVVADALWVVFSAADRFPEQLDAAFQTIVAAVTLAMVFVLQHTQARQEAVTQRKLDEILRALPAADNSMISLEAAPDTELEAATRSHRDVRAQTANVSTQANVGTQTNVGTQANVGTP